MITNITFPSKDKVGQRILKAPKERKRNIVKEKNQDNTRIIKVTGCHDCDKRGICIDAMFKGEGDKALYPKYWCPELHINIMSHFKNKTIPGNCPLDKLSSIQNNT